MKRCPECEFVYEESQSLCDMDGTELVHDPRELPKNPTKSRPGKSILQLVAMALPAILLATLLIYGSTPQEARTETSASGVIDQTETPGYIQPAAQPTTSSVTDESVKTDSMPPSSAEAESGSKSADKASSIRDETSQPSEIKTPAKPKSSPETTIGTPITAPKAVPPGTEPGVKRVPKKPSSTGSTSQNNAHESNTAKVKSFFKKTGRLLKKPFQN